MTADESTTVREQVIDVALRGLRAGLEADSFALHVAAVEPNGDVRLVLEARPGACLDCLVPEALLVPMLEDAIRKHDPAVGSVLLTKQGFDALEGDGAH